MITSLFFLAILLVGVPIGICLCLAGVVFILNSGSTVLFQSFPLQMFAGVDSYGLIAIPLFILIGEIMNSGGITRRLVELAMAFIGSVKGGLAYVNILANMMVASIIGSATAQRITAAVRRVRELGVPIAQIRVRNLNPLPANLGQLLHRADRVIVPEVNLGQFAMIVRAKYLVDARSWSRMRGLPLGVSELTEYLLSQVEEVQHV